MKDLVNADCLFIYLTCWVDWVIKNAVPVVDLWTACEGYSIYRAEFLIDGLHLNSRGNERLFEAVKLTIKENFPDLLPENLPMQLPEWSLINKRATTSTNNS